MNDRQIDAEIDAEIDARLRAAVIDDATVARLSLSPVAGDLAEEIMRMPVPVPTRSDAPPVSLTARRPRRRMKLVLATAKGDYPEAVAEVAPALAGEQSTITKKGADVVPALQDMLGCG